MAVPVIMYASELCGSAKKDVSHIQAMEMKFLKCVIRGRSNINETLGNVLLN